MTRVNFFLQNCETVPTALYLKIQLAQGAGILQQKTLDFESLVKF